MIAIVASGNDYLPALGWGINFKGLWDTCAACYEFLLCACILAVVRFVPSNRRVLNIAHLVQLRCHAVQGYSRPPVRHSMSAAARPRTGTQDVESVSHAITALCAAEGARPPSSALSDSRVF